LPNGGAKSQRRVIVIRQGKLAFRFGIVRYLMALEHVCDREEAQSKPVDRHDLVDRDGLGRPAG
jgi:hypothetical protein